MRIATWNVRWATSRAERGGEVRRRLGSLSADVLAVTEAGDAGVLPDGGHVIDAGDDWGYEVKPGRRKVALWSRHPWEEVRLHSEPDFPGGRCVSGTTRAVDGDVHVVGVCIPWRDAHVRSGARNRKPWEDHRRFLEALAPLLRSLREERVVVAGDFNQRLPRWRQPAGLAALLGEALEGFTLATAGIRVGPDARQLIDHVGVGPRLRAEAVEGWHGRDLSDHDGVTVDLGLDASASSPAG